MKIDSSTLQLDSAHRSMQRTEVRESLRAWIGNEPPPEEGGEVVSISAAARAAAAAPPPPPAEAQGIESAIENAESDPVLYFIKLVVEMLTGMQMKTVSAQDMPSNPPAKEHAAPENIAAAPPARAGFGIAYDRHEVREETELSTFQAQGIIRTSDGKEISLELDLSMYRSVREESSVSLRAGDAVRKDPLVINFDGTAAQLQERRFRFDIDGDGKTELVPLLAGNRGYLALDRNGNGKIDSGKELFGASGDGFAELAEFDSDGNGWIDDNDPVFAKLRVWMQDDKGGGTLETAKSHGVGALYLGRAQTPFALNGAENQSLGEIRSTGIYLAENGKAGTLQQIDVMV
ncbi:FG-GAP repeat domain-containing protein [Noviherbaspirillum denitrificans]|uniref:VCBS repeat-containing protein n=1 Tax=Noviherbaspirillum denitrificans TaxID=1968433 RepID=A0A254TKB7_9BURK|nr:VCBS repeat-containing protein [Noviherbaspirillum denitrificans]OWW23014.1 hypothetical protein AYR66_22785 [Noviherbaspirillum denitrificans]